MFRHIHDWLYSHRNRDHLQQPGPVTTATLPVGSDPITASYGGDPNFNSATANLAQVVNKATPSITLASSANPSSVNQSVTFTTTLPATATGTVTFKSGATVIGTSNVSSGIATVSTTTLPVGSNPITATYSGDANNNTASASLTQTVNKATPAITLTSPAYPKGYPGFESLSRHDFPAHPIDRLHEAWGGSESVFVLKGRGFNHAASRPF